MFRNLIHATARTVVALLLIEMRAPAHDPIYVTVDTSGPAPRLAVAPGSQAILNGETTLNFATGGVYVNQYVTDLPAYDATLFPFSTYPGVQLLLQRVHFPGGFGMYAAAGSTTPILTTDGAYLAFTGHTHYVHHSAAPGMIKASFRFLDGGGQLIASNVFTVTFRAYRSGIDSDGDGVLDQFDNCINTPNSDQADADGDSVGNACDDCPNTADRDQGDLDQNGLGDSCACAGQPCQRADVNQDGRVDTADLALCAASFSSNTFPPAPPGNLRCDVNHDGRIDLNDWIEIYLAMAGHLSSEGNEHQGDAP